MGPFSFSSRSGPSLDHRSRLGCGRRRRGPRVGRGGPGACPRPACACSAPTGRRPPPRGKTIVAWAVTRLVTRSGRPGPGLAHCRMRLCCRTAAAV